MNEKVMTQFKAELTALINKYSLGVSSGTPDFLLAQYLCECLKAYDNCLHAAFKWHTNEEDK